MKPGTGKKVLVAMSGGVDSSVTAALLKDDGYEVVGCFMRNGEEESVETSVGCRVSGVGSEQNPLHGADTPLEPKPETRNPTPASKNRQGCCSVNDAADARLVAAILDIPFYVLNFRKDFNRIKDYFTAEYNAGRTPNPCVRCNDWLKFGRLFDYARSIDAHYIATGHYARIEPLAASHAPRLLRGIDHHKDQSYVLFGLTHDRLARMLLPIGSLRKPRVREIAHEKNLPVFNKPDSYEICFVPDNDYRGFLHRRDPAAFESGTILDTAGSAIGTHDGHQNFTIGQRRGLPVNRSYPLYVIAKDAAANTITLGPREESNATGLRADQTNWLIDPPQAPRRCTAKIRSNAEPVAATVTATGEGTLEVTFDEPQHAVTPGQAVVCYDGEELIGGGWITQAAS